MLKEQRSRRTRTTTGLPVFWEGPLLPYRSDIGAAGCDNNDAEDVWGETCNGEDDGSCPSGSCKPVPFAARAYSASGTQKIFEDSPLPEYVVDATDGFVLYNDRDTLGDAVKDLTKVESESIYAETYAELFNLALHNNEALFETFGDTVLTTATATNSGGAFNLDLDGDGEYDDGLECGGCGGLASQFKTVARLLKMGREDLGSERDGFYTQRGAWDTHNTLGRGRRGQGLGRRPEPRGVSKGVESPGRLEGHDDRGFVGLWSNLNLERQGHGPRLGRQHVRAWWAMSMAVKCMVPTRRTSRR